MVQRVLVGPDLWWRANLEFILVIFPNETGVLLVRIRNIEALNFFSVLD